MISRFCCSALPICFSTTFLWYKPAIIQIITAVITNVTIIAIVKPVTGAPPYLVFIVQNTTYQFYPFLVIMSSEIQHTHPLIGKFLLYCQSVY